MSTEQSDRFENLKHIIGIIFSCLFVASILSFFLYIKCKPLSPAAAAAAPFIGTWKSALDDRELILERFGGEMTATLTEYNSEDDAYEETYGTWSVANDIAKVEFWTGNLSLKVVTFEETTLLAPYPTETAKLADCFFHWEPPPEDPEHGY